jgi:hypothetical protein
MGNMPQSLQPIKDAINRGNKNKAIELIKQALSYDPNDIDVLLVLAAIVDEPTRKRQVLNRILSLAPTNQAARNMLVEMDRAALGGMDRRPTPMTYPISSQETRISSASISPGQSRSQSLPIPPSVKTKSLSFRMPLMTRLSFYLITALGLYMNITTIINGETELTLLSFVLFIGMCIISLGFSFRVEVSDAGILVDAIITASRIGWNEISEIKSGSFQHGLDLKRKAGKSVKISGAVSGYPAIVEILRQKRPDLFGMESLTHGSSAVSFAGTKTYKKSLLMQYSGILIGIPLLFFSVFAILKGFSEIFFVGIFLGPYSIYLIFQPFFHAYEIKIEPNLLTFEMFFEQKEFPASQIEKIWIKTVRGRYGSAFHYVMVKPLHGRVISLRGFGVGEEVLYGNLMNWWNSHQNK